MPVVKRIFYSIVFVVVLVTGLLLFTRNNQVIFFDFLVGKVDLPLSLLLLGALCLGAALGMLSMLSVLLRLRQQKSRLQRQAQLAEKEINNLRVLPLRDQP